MKKVTRAIILLMSLAMLFSLSCGDDDDDGSKKIVNPGGTTATNSITANVTGKYTVTISGVATSTKDIDTNSITVFGAGTVSGATSNIMITLNVNKGTGTFQLLEDWTGVNDGWATFVRTVNNTPDYFIATSGTVTLTEVTPRFKGTFQFTAQNSDGETVTVSNGSFNTAYTTTQ